MQAFGLAVSGAAVVAICSAFFGVTLARLVWAEDLRSAQFKLETAQQIDEVRSRTEGYMRNEISSLKKHIEILQNQSSK